MKKQEIIYFDPLQYDGSKYLQAALNWLRHEAIDKKSLSLADLTPESCTWKLIQERENQPQQKGNGTECGVFLCVTADCVADDIPITSTLYTLNDMRVHNYRRKLGCDILRGSFHEYPTVFA
jgi:Ulp1 family protease